jgi:NAD(P)H-hydrate epimerase
MDYLDEKCMDINYSNSYGDTYELMKNAGKSISDFVISMFPAGKSIAIVCGTGNNAGDGICCGKYLLEKYKVSIILIKGVAGLKTPESRRAINEYSGKYYSTSSLNDILANSDIIIDAVFGIGVKGEPREPYKDIIAGINESTKTIISVDVPSGFPTNISVKPDYTVTFTDVKTGMKRENSGNIIVSDIGIPESIKHASGPGDLVYIPVSQSESHKGMNGILGILAGREFSGAAIMSSLSAYNTGLDLVKVYSNEENRPIILSYNPGLMFYGIKKENSVDMSNPDAILIGPGMGKTEESRRQIEYVVDNYKGQLILDADALKIITPSKLSGRNAIVTPHKGEFTAFTGLEPTEDNAVEIAGKYGLIILLKGKTDIITDGNRIKYSAGGNSRMTMGGTGDALSGIVAGIAARGVNPFQSAVTGSFINKKCGDMAFEKYGYYYGIMDMIDNIKIILNNKI